ncbi:IucA/IucC family siderophore biosynthesis protein (plasmid) [Rhizobium gallicum bv. gallicum R602sp]|uniref:IucA/IucC family siderophore biosynthesis protein n=1 Tax=Rhizobium gallicum bv. gallicum R602sp TaxID=1041138 RepID=A0A0B4XB00_9HYPH|nr:IucA/IucC family protein [Rhizobium gallicum]AJD43915.1 IucA/IucC family siderophore biosynthesis protein [Rhizobium gallicum bv. gallicum R602sp]
MDKNISSAADPIHSEDRALLTNASRNAINRLVRCLFAERLLDPDALLWAKDDREAWFPLWASQRVLHFTDLRLAPAGIVQNRGQVEVLYGTGGQQRIEDPAALISEVVPSLAITPAPNGLEHLLRDVDSSVCNDILARRHREQWSSELRGQIAQAGASGFLAYLEENLPPHLAAMTLDQWGALEGHPFYPTWKAKPGLAPEDVVALSPEFGARVRLRIVALRSDWAYVEKMPHVGGYSEWFARNFPELWRDWADGMTARGKATEDWVPLPVHAWHLENFVRREFAPEIEAGVLDPDGPELVTLPSMSFRTMLPESEEPRPFVKVPVAIRMTSAQRTLQGRWIRMGPRLSTRISDILSKEDDLRDEVEIFTEELGAILRHPDTGDEHRGRFLSVVYRNVDALARCDGLLPVTVAALLTASPLDDRPLICELIARNGTESEATVAAFFRGYARTVVRPALTMYLLYGIAFEAHQQNSIILFDSHGQPRKLLIRDFGDGRSFAPLSKERGYVKGVLSTTFDDDIRPVRSYLIYACFFCHLHEIALCLTDQYSVLGDSLWRVLREETEKVFEALRPRMLSNEFWTEERQAFLEQPWPAHSVMRTLMERNRDSRAEHQMPNPLADELRSAQSPRYAP